MMHKVCPVCTSTESKNISEKLVLCKICRTVYNVGYSSIPYSEDYFVEEYRQQYGKTYEDDFESIYAAAVHRLHKIDRVIRNDASSKALLDIGCALGFFCKAARDKGFGVVEGLEVSTYASEYCASQYNILVHNIRFEEFFPEKRYDVITAWYVMEHFIDPYTMFSKVYSLLNSKGVFACTLPSYFGPLYVFRKEEWVASHPLDHRIDVSPRSIKQLLMKIGYSKVYCHPSGYHPERCGTTAMKYKRLYKKLSDILCFSDTIFVIAQKNM